MKRILTILVTLSLLATLGISVFGATYHIDDLRDGDILFPGDTVNGIVNNYYNAWINVTDAWDTDAPQYVALGGNATKDLYYLSLIYEREPVLPTAEELYNDPNRAKDAEMVLFNYYVYYFDYGFTNLPSFFAAYNPIYDALEEVNENGEDFWKWWRNAARLVRTEKTVTLNVPEEIDNTILPTFLFTAIKEANANVTLNINGETYSLNANNLPSYYAWVSEVSVEILK